MTRSTRNCAEYIGQDSKESNTLAMGAFLTLCLVHQGPVQYIAPIVRHTVHCPLQTLSWWILLWTPAFLTQWNPNALFNDATCHSLSRNHEICNHHCSALNTDVKTVDFYLSHRLQWKDERGTEEVGEYCSNQHAEFDLITQTHYFQSFCFGSL